MQVTFLKASHLCLEVIFNRRFKILFIFHIYHRGSYESHAIEQIRFFCLSYYLKCLSVSFVLLPLLHVDIIHLIEIGEIVLAYSCPVTPNYPIFVLFHLLVLGLVFFFPFTILDEEEHFYKNLFFPWSKMAQIHSWLQI